MCPLPDKPIQVEVSSRHELRDWLLANHNKCSNGIWLVTHKKHCPDQYISYDDIVEEALCFGWIDSLPRKLDADRSMLRLTPRKPGSGWSKRNKERVARLITNQLMTPAGMAIMNASKTDGSWCMLDSIENLEIPPDLQAAFNHKPPARQNFDAFPRSVKRGILEWILQAKKPQTRHQRIQKTATLAKDNIRANQWKR